MITGASGGIGYELAKLFAKDHHNLVLVARNGLRLAQVADELQRQFKITVKTLALDLTEPSAPLALFAQLQSEGVAVDILVNNAGYGQYGEFADVPREESLGQIQLNITALTELTKLFLGPMLERGSGRIMNVASTAGFQPGPLMAVYYATKAYVISFSEALANELADKGITRDLPLSGSDRDCICRPRRQRRDAFVQEPPSHGCKDRGSRRLPRSPQRQDTGDSRIPQLAGRGIHPRLATEDGDGSFALDFRKSGIKNGGRASRPVGRRNECAREP